MSEKENNIEEEIDKDEDLEGEEEVELQDSEDISNSDKELLDLEEELSKEKEDKEVYIGRLQRLQAEFSNYRKRVAKEKSLLTNAATKDFILDLLPVIDNFERALSSSKDEDNQGLFEGVKMIHRQLLALLKSNGAEEIKTIGEEFDPNFHNAVMKEASQDYESGIIIEELQKGYIFNDIAIRPAMVKVAE